MKNPSEDLPRVLNVAVTSVVAASVLFNIAIYCVVPFQVVRDTKTPVVVCLLTSRLPQPDPALLDVVVEEKSIPTVTDYLRSRNLQTMFSALLGATFIRSWSQYLLLGHLTPTSTILDASTCQQLKEAGSQLSSVKPRLQQSNTFTLSTTVRRSGFRSCLLA